MALSFPSTGDKAVSAVNFGTLTKFSASVIARAATGASNGAYWGLDGGGLGGVNIFLFNGASSLLSLYIADGVVASTSTCDYTSYYDADTSIVVVWDGTAGVNSDKLKIYLNGALQTLSFDAGAVMSTGATSGSLLLGDFDAVGSHWILSEYAAWPGMALTADQVLQIAVRKGYPLSVPGAVPTVYLSMVRDIRDQQGSAGTPTLTGTTIAVHPRVYR